MLSWKPVWSRAIKLSAVLAFPALLMSCGGGTSSAPGVSGACDVTISSQPQALTAAEVETIVAQGAQAANQIGAKATIAVVDRVGNVLALYKMDGAGATISIRSGKVQGSVPKGLDGLSGVVPSEAAAIAKAITGAYLSSSGNAFSTRTASFIVQEHFPVGVDNMPGGPLFGVQFSQLPCGDLVTRGAGIGGGPKRSPLGLSADPGGFPLYKNGRVVGGVGVMADGIYGLDESSTPGAVDLDERLAQSALKGFDAPACIRAERITAGGISLPFSKSDAYVVSVTAKSLSDSSLSAVGELVDFAEYYRKTAILEGTAFGDPGSGFAPDTASFTAGRGYVLVNRTDGANRYPVSAAIASLSSGSGSTGSTLAPLAKAEVQEILAQALGVANQARAQIRSPLGSPAQVTISVVDTAGNVLGLVRTPDAPVFGTDVSLQKARTALFFSSPQAEASLSALPQVGYFDRNLIKGTPFDISQYLTDPQRGARTFFNNPAIFQGGTAFSARAIGNIARPYFPDGIAGYPQGPFSKAIADWSPFNTGLQLDLIYTGFVNAIVDPTDRNKNCTGQTGVSAGLTGVNNGIQIFPGGVPVYRGDTLIGGLGVSGDGVDQDDMIAFLGLARAGKALNTGVANAPASRRSDTLTAQQGLNLRYVQCPQAPFNNSVEQNVCQGI
jgi:uncharacterized protein GlcG (DUF336 family)